MTPKNTPAMGKNIGGALRHHETLNQKLGETAATVSPLNYNPAGEHGSIVQAEFSTSRPPVELNGHLRALSEVGDDLAPPEDPQSEPEPNATSTETPTTTTPATKENPNSDLGAANKENDGEITAEEIMAKHTEQTPSEENGFSLDDVVATQQVAPVNLARAAGANFRKPTDKEFIRVTGNPEDIKPLDILEVDDKTSYIVTPAVMAAINKLHEEEGKVIIKTKRKLVHLTVNIDGVGFLWPITVMDSENTWLDSAHICAGIAKDQWIRVVSNNPAKRYDFHTANKHAGTAPKWPKGTFIEMLNLAFKGKIIRSLDHPVIKQLLDDE